jgi:hypothetical protein
MEESDGNEGVERSEGRSEFEHLISSEKKIQRGRGTKLSVFKMSILRASTFQVNRSF